MIFPPENRFELRSSLNAHDAKKAIRAILDVNPRSRRNLLGFAIGRLVWIVEGFGRTAPTIWAWIEESEDGVHVHGIRRVSVFTKLGIVMAALVLFAYAGITLQAQPILLAALLLTGLLVSGWVDKKFVSDSDRMLRILAQALDVNPPLTAESQAVRQSSLKRLCEPLSHAVEGFQLTFNGDLRDGAPSAMDLADEIALLKTDDFIILATEGGDFMQTVLTDDGFMVEYQSAGLENHFRSTELLGRTDIQRLFEHYLATRTPHPDLTWERIKL